MNWQKIIMYVSVGGLLLVGGMMLWIFYMLSLSMYDEYKATINISQSDPHILGKIQEIEDISAGGFGTDTKCIVKVNNVSRVLSGWVCSELQTGKMLGYKNYSTPTYSKIRYEVLQ